MKRVRIGNGCGFWGDNLDAPIRLAQAGRLDYLTLEYLAELTMSILAVQRARDPAAGRVQPTAGYSAFARSSRSCQNFSAAAW